MLFTAFFGFKAPAAAPERESVLQSVVPDETALLQALRTAYRNPTIASTQAMHEDVVARHPQWTVNLRRVRRLLGRVVAQHEAQESRGEDSCDEEEGWCVIRTPRTAAPAAVSVSELWAGRRRGSA